MPLLSLPVNSEHAYSIWVLVPIIFGNTYINLHKKGIQRVRIRKNLRDHKQELIETYSSCAKHHFQLFVVSSGFTTTWYTRCKGSLGVTLASLLRLRMKKHTNVVLVAMGSNSSRRRRLLAFFFFFFSMFVVGVFIVYNAHSHFLRRRRCRLLFSSLLCAKYM